MDFFDQLQHQTNAEREYLLGAPIIHAIRAAPAERGCGAARGCVRCMSPLAAGRRCMSDSGEAVGDSGFGGAPPPALCLRQASGMDLARSLFGPR